MPKRYFKNVLSDNGDILSNCSDAFWKGTSGIAYMFYHLATSDKFKNESEIFLNKAITVLQLKGDIFYPKSNGKFLCGDAGINAVNASIYHLIGDSKMAEMYLTHFKKGVADYRLTNLTEKDELFVGRAGYLYGVLWLEKVFGKKIVADQDIFELCSAIVESGRKYSVRNKSIFPLMYSYYGKEYLGAAHGLSTIIQVLLSFPQFIEKEPQTKQDIKNCIDIMKSLQTSNGNFPTKMPILESKQRSEEDELVHWCHGAPGVIYLFAKAYLVFKDPSYLECCLKCGDLVWTKGLLKKGPGICHGIAGNGYVFLLLYRLTGDKKHLNRALKFGEFIFTDECIQRSRKPDHLYSLYEGLAGTVCYLTDLIQPEKASFPFLDVF
ncbi:lanC-like protein 3 isoform X2 [Sipha flava]|uniref:LanC-like protein 3 homolog n=1 Tax=Sipha flava TaxID=143950 RepID=A0A8B8FXR3_9HEMI|nr:lanC-like protein 3 isoform X2 [Sipha flava]